MDAAGPWAAEVAALAGIALPAEPVCRQVFRTAPFAGLPPTRRWRSRSTCGFWFRPHEGGFWWGRSDEHEPSGLDQAPRPRLGRALPPNSPVAACRSFARARVVGGWSGFYTMTPDAHGLIGGFPEPRGFYCATGFSGHGFQHSPATGLLLAEIILDGRATTLDIHALRPTRFAEGEPIVETVCRVKYEDEVQKYERVPRAQALFDTSYFYTSYFSGAAVEQYTRALKRVTILADFERRLRAAHVLKETRRSSRRSTSDISPVPLAGRGVLSQSLPARATADAGGAHPHLRPPARWP